MNASSGPANEASTNWQFTVITFGVEREGGEGIRRSELTDAFMDVLAAEGADTAKVVRVIPGGSLSATTGGPSDIPRYPEGVSPFYVGDAIQFVIENHEWLVGAVSGGIIGNRADALTVGLFRKLKNKRRARKLVKLDRESAIVRAKSAIGATFPEDVDRMMPDLLYVDSEASLQDGSWEFTFRNRVFPEPLVFGEVHFDNWIYSAKMQAVGTNQRNADDEYISNVSVRRDRIYSGD